MKGQENKQSFKGEILVSGSCTLSGLTTWDQLKSHNTLVPSLLAAILR